MHDAILCNPFTSKIPDPIVHKICPSMDIKWHKAFKEDQENVEDDPRSGRPISSTYDQNVEVVRAVMAKDRRLSVRMIAE